MGRNILLVVTHDTGRYVAPYGAAVATPNVSRLAEEGVLFTRAYCTAPQCSPSRASFLTGLVPTRHGLIGLTHRGFRLRPGVPTLPRLLGNAGYETHLFGFQHEARDARDLGYRHVHKAASNACRDVAPLVCEFLRGRPRWPFFAMVGFQEAHRPFPHAPHPVPQAAVPHYLPSAEAVRRDLAGLQEAVRRFDAALGDILRALEETGAKDSTLVLYTTDHGIAFPGAKATLFEPGVEIALIARGPEPFRGGRIVSSLVSNVDVLPTLLEWAGVPPPEGLDGRSLLPLLTGGAEAVRDAVWFELTYHAAYDPMRGIRTERYKYIHSYEEKPVWVGANVDGGPSKDWFLTHRPWLFTAQRPREYLFDLAQDPQERRNLADSPAHSAVLEELRARVESTMRANGDPLLGGTVPAPEGARVDG